MPQAEIWTLVLLVLSNIVGVWKVTASQNKRFDDRFLKAERHLASEFANVNKQFNDISLQMTRILEGDIRELKNTIERIEESLETSRTKTDNLFNQISTLVLKVNRLETKEEERRTGNDRRNH